MATLGPEHQCGDSPRHSRLHLSWSLTSPWACGECAVEQEADLVSLPPSVLGPGGLGAHCLDSSFLYWNCPPSDTTLLLCLPADGGPSLPGGPARLAAPSVPVVVWRAFSTKATGLENQLARAERWPAPGPGAHSFREAFGRRGEREGQDSHRQPRCHRNPRFCSRRQTSSPSHFGWHPLCQCPLLAFACLPGALGGGSLTLHLLND